MPLLRRFGKNSDASDKRRRRPIVFGLVLVVSLALVFGDCPSGYAVTPRPQDEAPPPPAPKKQTRAPANPALAQPETFPASKVDQKKAKEAYKRGFKSEAAGDWQAAFDAYSVAVDFDATVTQYEL